ncbi:hypothetical protein N0Y54_43640 [Nostoc punctiforme UO1]|uniref:hypothetical protein n=1 Tax=Nostoc punctiforme TaxID=272131 RepID=UPI0030AD7AFD
MQNLTRIHDSTLLTQSGVYQIDRTLYRYLEKTGTVKAQQYIFRPLPDFSRDVESQML